jgi:hypothetical protein
MYKILIPHNLSKNIKIDLYKWKNKIVKYNKPYTELIKYTKPNKGIIYSVSRTNNCKEIIIYDNKNENKNKYIIENIIDKKYCMYGIYSWITAFTISGISYGYVIYNDIELFFLL